MMTIIRTNYHNICLFQLSPNMIIMIIYFSSTRLITLLYLSLRTSNQRIESRYHCFQTSSSSSPSTSTSTPSTSSTSSSSISSTSYTSSTCRCSAACWRDFGFSSFFSTQRLPQGQYSDHDDPQEDDDDSQENENVH